MADKEDDHLKSVLELESELVEARERIRELEDRLAPDSVTAMKSDVFEHHLDVVLYIDAGNGDIRWANRAAVVFYGYSRTELVSMHISDLNILGREETKGLVRQVWNRTRSRFLFTHRLKNGELRNVEVYSVPMVLDGCEMLCSFIRDVTDLKDTETSTEKGAVFQETVLISMGMVPFYCRNSGDYEPTYIGGSIFAVTGFPTKDFYVDSGFWFSRVHEEDMDKVADRFRRLPLTGATRCEYRWQVADGSWRWFALSMRLVACEEGESPDVTCVAGLFWDITDRKRTEKALIEREERYRTVADFTHDWEFWVGPSGDFLYISPSFERVTGYLPEELKRQPSILFDKLVHPMDREWVHTNVFGRLLSPDPVSFDFRIITKTGDVRWIGHVSQPVYDDKGDPVGRRASNRDITELKETMQALQEKNQFINAIMDNSTAIIYAKDVDGRYLFGNNRFMEYVDKPVQEVLGKTDYGLFSNEVADTFKRSDQQVLETGDPLSEEVEMSPKGSPEHWTTTKFPLFNSEGNVLGVCGISLDVTEWRETETSLRRLARAVEQSPVSIAMTDTEGRILSVNPYFCSASGYDEEDVLGRRLGFMLADESVSFYEPVWRKVRQGEDWHGEIRNRTRNGDILWEGTSISPVRDSRDRIINFVVVKDDITERKRLERLEKDVERIVRHDLRSPIMSFIWVPRSLRKASNITDEQSVLLHELEQSGHRLLKMVNLSLDLFKMEEGVYQFTPEDLNILRIIQNVLHDLKKTITALNVHVELRMDGRNAAEGDCLLVRGEEILFHSMISNLIKNAVEASKSGDVVTVDCRSGEETIIRVHNPAVVPADIRETFFEKYSTSGKKFGTGLGTYSARLIVETQGGSIRMASAEGLGTEVVVSFPSGGGD